MERPPAGQYGCSGVKDHCDCDRVRRWLAKLVCNLEADTLVGASNEGDPVFRSLTQILQSVPWNQHPLRRAGYANCYAVQHFRKAPWKKLKLYAQHADGRKLFHPQWDSDGQIYLGVWVGHRQSISLMIPQPTAPHLQSRTSWQEPASLHRIEPVFALQGCGYPYDLSTGNTVWHSLT